MTIPEEVIDAVRERTSLAEIASELVQLRQSGRRWTGLCPFHKEKTPSFSINDEDGLYHCFGCSAKGDVFSFVCETKGFSFPEAVRYLASRAGIEIPEDNRNADGNAKRLAEEKRRYRELVYLATKIFHRELANEVQGRRAREYLQSRGVSEQTAKTFLLGFAPESWEFLENAVKAELTTDERTHLKDLEGASLRALLVRLGLLKMRRNQSDQENSTKDDTAKGNDQESEVRDRGVYDAFRNRIIFPIQRSDGVPIAFGGRTLSSDKEVPKYINSSENPLYEKRRTLYGLSQAREAIRKTRHVYVVEGYLDVLSMYQRGFQNTLATCGTALTLEHTHVLKRLVDTVTIFFDGDVAGRTAAARCFDVFLNTGLDVRVVHPPEGEDPDSLAQRFEQHKLEKLFDTRSKPLAVVFLQHLLEKQEIVVSKASAAQVGKCAKQFAERLAKVTNPVEQERLLLEGSKVFDVGMSSLVALVEQVRLSGDRSERPAANVARSANPVLTQRDSRAVVRSKLISKDSPLTAQEVYQRQLVVAVLSDTTLASSISNIPSLLEGTAPLDIVSEDVRNFIRVLSGAGLRGVLDLLTEHNQLVGVDRERLESLLEQFNLGGQGLLEETERQCRIGGGSPANVVLASQRLSAEKSLNQLTDKIRQEERNELADDQLTNLAQRKLVNRRNLELLRQSVRDGKSV